MKWKTVDSLAEIITKGTTPSTVGFDFCNDGVVFLRAQNVLDNSLRLSEDVLYISQECHTSFKRSRILSGDVLLSIAGAIGRACVVPPKISEMNCNQAVAIIRPSSEIFPYYLSYWLNSDFAQQQIKAGTVSATISNFSLGEIKKLKIPLPPLAEQRRIAAILDKADAIRRKRQQSLELADSLLKSVFWGMFGDPVTNPKGWEKFRVGTVLETIEAGWSANGVARLKQQGELAVLKVSAVTYGVFNEGEYKVIENGTSIKKHVYPQKGDLLFSRANTRELVGATCLIFNDYPELLLPDKLWKLHFTKKTNNCYMKFALSSADARGQMTEESTGTSGSMYNISMEKLKNIRVCLPPVALQSKFAAIAESMEASRCILRQANNEADHAFKSLQQSFFG